MGKHYGTGVKVYHKNLKRNLIISHSQGEAVGGNGEFYTCIDPNISMNKNRCGLYNCFEDDLQIGWVENSELPEESEEPEELWCITTSSMFKGEVLYLGWQKPIYGNDNGYFWTSKEILQRIFDQSTPEHPFFFRGKSEAIAHLRTLNIPQKCRVVEW